MCRDEGDVQLFETQLCELQCVRKVHVDCVHDGHASPWFSVPCGVPGSVFLLAVDNPEAHAEHQTLFHMFLFFLILFDNPKNNGLNVLCRAINVSLGVMCVCEIVIVLKMERFSGSGGLQVKVSMPVPVETCGGGRRDVFRCLFRFRANGRNTKGENTIYTVSRNVTSSKQGFQCCRVVGFAHSHASIQMRESPEGPAVPTPLPHPRSPSSLSVPFHKCGLMVPTPTLGACSVTPAF